MVLVGQSILKIVSGFSDAVYAEAYVKVTGFDILLGRTEVTVPWVDPRSDYQVVREFHCLITAPLDQP